jgi:hypothetical protein
MISLRSSKQAPHFANIIRNKWFFPAILLILLVILTAFRMSGSSVGQYHDHLYGTASSDPSLIAGEPRKIRSDEWGVNTPLTVSQVKEGFPVINKTAGQGQDMALTFDVPYAEWSTIFKPQNWSFFVLPVEFAFAFKWWLMAILLMLACYICTITLLPRKYLLGALLSVALFCSPFIHWWYQAGSMLSIAYALFSTALILRILKESSRPRLYIELGLLTYFLTCFAFIAYVPFIVPLALVTASFLAGHVLNEALRTKDRTAYLRRIALLIAPVFITCSLFLIFLHMHSAVIQALGNSVYPGDRTEPSGGYSILQLLGGYYNLQLQNDTRASGLNLNQSEASNFILLIPFLLPLFIYTFAWRTKLKVQIDWRVIALLSVLALFLMRLFVPASEILFNALQLNRIPHNRLLIGVGLINIFLIIIAVQHISKISVPLMLQRISALLALSIVIATGVGLKVQFVGYLENVFKIGCIGVVFALITWMLLAKRYAIAFALLATYSLFSVIQVNPLYQGLGIIQNSHLSTEITRIGDTNGKWVVGDQAAFVEELPAAQGVDTLSGVYAYPQLSVWSGIGDDPATQAVYNRYAHVFFSVESLYGPTQKLDSYFDPPALDAFRVHTDPCGEFLQQQHVRYVLMTQELVSSCAQKIATIPYPATTFFVYELTSSR